MLQAFITLSSVILGFVLSQYSERKKALNAESKKKINLHRLLQIETEENTLAIRKYWEHVLATQDKWLNEKNEFKYALLAKEVSEKPFPVLSSVVWYSNLSEIPSYLDLSKIERLWIFYQRLERITALYNFFCNRNAERKDEMQNHRMLHGTGGEHIAAGYGFAESVSENSKKFKDLVEKVLQFHINAQI